MGEEEVVKEVLGALRPRSEGGYMGGNVHLIIKRSERNAFPVGSSQSSGEVFSSSSSTCSSSCLPPSSTSPHTLKKEIVVHCEASDPVWSILQKIQLSCGWLPHRYSHHAREMPEKSLRLGCRMKLFGGEGAAFVMLKEDTILQESGLFKREGDDDEAMDAIQLFYQGWCHDASTTRTMLSAPIKQIDDAGLNIWKVGRMEIDRAKALRTIGRLEGQIAEQLAPPSTESPN
tara:strand:+ start:78 stop:770 length:693 start_codon:yes stop_codon:yes gene_type:complete